jgi:hypothetical protein
MGVEVGWRGVEAIPGIAHNNQNVVFNDLLEKLIILTL